jgi:hypothetical protein
MNAILDIQLCIWFSEQNVAPSDCVSADDTTAVWNHSSPFKMNYSARGVKLSQLGRCLCLEWLNNQYLDCFANRTKGASPLQIHLNRWREILEELWIRMTHCTCFGSSPDEIDVVLNRCETSTSCKDWIQSCCWTVTKQLTISTHNKNDRMGMMQLFYRCKQIGRNMVWNKLTRGTDARKFPKDFKSVHLI